MKALILLVHSVVGKADRRKICSIAFLIDAKEAFISANPTLIHNSYKALLDEGAIEEKSEYERDITKMGRDKLEIPIGWEKTKKTIKELVKYDSTILYTAATTYYNLRVLQGRGINFVDAVCLAEKVADIHNWRADTYSLAALILFDLGLVTDGI